MPGREPVVDAVVAEAVTVEVGHHSDATLEWDSVTMVLVEVRAGGSTGTGYTYGHALVADVVREILAPLLVDRSALDITSANATMRREVRNIGRPGMVAMAVSAVDVALWDLRARLLEVPLATLLGAADRPVPLYGSGGLTSSGPAAVAEQLGGWAAEGFDAVKMKIGRDPTADPARVAAARQAVGDDTTLMVDANGAFTPREASRTAFGLAEHGVSWFEEPVSSDDLAGATWLRDRLPPGMALAAGEYGHQPQYFATLLDAGAVDVVQADATRCGGYSGFLEVASLCAAHQVPLSTHTAPQLHAPVAAAAPTLLHLEWFADHVVVEQHVFENPRSPSAGTLEPDRGAHGHGLVRKAHR